MYVDMIIEMIESSCSVALIVILETLISARIAGVYVYICEDVYVCMYMQLSR